MIVYDRLWKTLKEKGISQYKLINEFQISPGQLTRLRKNESVTTHTIDVLCSILDCDIHDIMEYKSNHRKK
ncbi:MAG: helix-turn-helix transcriptional regulator [Solobacterium sp.]|nr:helix-turn-helix transcriptional regulator [Solobacterium sp.]